MELRHLRYFVAVAEEMNFHRAANRLNISQPPLSMQIRQLEDELGTPLFIRHKRQIELTPAGVYFLEKSRHILSETQSSVDTARNVANGTQGSLNIHFISSAAAGFLQSCVVAFKKRYPDVRILLHQRKTIGTIKAIVDKEADISIARYPADLSAGVVVRKHVPESYYVALPTGHSLLKKKKELRIEDIAHEPQITFPRFSSPASFDDIISLFTDKGFTPHIVQESIEQLTIAGLVAAGLGVSVVPEVMKNVKIPGLAHLPLKGTKKRTGVLLLSGKTLSPQAQNFLDCIPNALCGAPKERPQK